MKEIKDEHQFFDTIGTENTVIIFVFHNWSGYSVIAKKAVEDWQQKSSRNIYLLDASEMSGDDYFTQWICKQEEGNWSENGGLKVSKFSPRNRIHGYGETAYQSYQIQALEERATELFI